MCSRKPPPEKIRQDCLDKKDNRDKGASSTMDSDMFHKEIIISKFFKTSFFEKKFLIFFLLKISTFFIKIPFPILIVTYGSLRTFSNLDYNFLNFSKKNFFFQSSFRKKLILKKVLVVEKGFSFVKRTH